MARTQGGIQAFARVSKPASTRLESTKKRKGRDLGDVQTDGTGEVKKRCLQLETPPDTPTKACKRLLADLKLSAPQTPALKSAKRKRVEPLAVQIIDTPPTSPASSQDTDALENETSYLPAELEELESLSASFLSALSLHYVHNGTSTPVDVRSLTPSIAKLWRKRKVGIDDVRLCIGLLDRNRPSSPTRFSSSFTLLNYGNGKFCIELAELAKKQAPIGQPFDETRLQSLFRQRIRTEWQSWINRKMDLDVAAFLKQLPRAEVPMSASAAKAATLMSKGQRRLEELMKGREEGDNGARKRSRPGLSAALLDGTNIPTVSAASKDSDQVRPATTENKLQDPTGILTANIRGLSLLERIKTKEIQRANLGPVPTKAELERRAALQRAEELLGILELLSSSKGSALRASFPLPALVQSVRGSLRSPMSKDEIERCLQVLERDIAPGYVSTAKFGSLVGVVVNRGCRPSKECIHERLRANGVV